MALEQAKAELESFQYLSSRAKDILAEKGLWAKAGMEEFLSDHLQYVMPGARVFNEIMGNHSGCPIGIEYEHWKEPGRFAVVLPDASHPGKCRVQLFDEHGFSSHSTIGKIEKAVEEMIQMGYRSIAKGALSRLSKTKTWEIGSATAVLLQQLNGGKISYQEFMERRDALYSQKDEPGEVRSGYVVMNENTLGYLTPVPFQLGVLAGSMLKGGHDPLNGVALITPSDRLRPAKKADFDTFRVVANGYLTC
ncbi:MAG: hypothetical protein WC314_25670 [Vulcanimicrobiota bacterium]